MKRLAALILAAATGVIGAAPAQACWFWPWGMGYYGYSAGYGGQYGAPAYPSYNVGYRPSWGMGYPQGFAAYTGSCCAPVCCDPCGGACSGGACAGGACGGTGGAQSGGSLKPQVDSNFQGGSGTYDADPATPAGPRRAPAGKAADPADPSGSDATFDAPATPRRPAPAGSTDDFNSSGAATEEITPFGAETGVSNKPPVPEIKDLDPVQPDSTFAPEPAPAEAQPATDAAAPAADPAAGKPAAEDTGSGDAFLPVEPTAPAPKPAVPEARRTLPGSVVAGQGSRMHEVLRPARLAQKPASGSLTQKPVPDAVRWISAPLSEGHARL